MTETTAQYESTPTSEALIEAARAEFTRRGFDGARVARIAEEAGVNKERIYGYFGSKEGLFEVVMAKALTEHAEQTPFLEGQSLTDHVMAAFEHHRRDPELVRLLMWESLHYDADQGQTPPFSDGRRDFYRRKVERLQQVSGEQDALRAAIAMFVAIGLQAAPFMVPQLGAVILGRPVADAEVQELMRPLIEQTVRFIEDGLVRESGENG
ncbi:TetR/AcrR family transcriptional regulator [Tsukamurella strandjordii]|uniref:TetR/AcrR family transcriptional regulator n=1 Tax=Tsukamurella TaxID=2060 RepID=UPI00207D918F|nr:TetR/AcrR family transcriptional regulator [Tsukamurella sp. TY48]GIZ98833.1 TetR family transcriptional regulator [Tsukamurella sp. TY48]